MMPLAGCRGRCGWCAWDIGCHEFPEDAGFGKVWRDTERERREGESKSDALLLFRTSLWLPGTRFGSGATRLSFSLVLRDYNYTASKRERENEWRGCGCAWGTSSFCAFLL